MDEVKKLIKECKTLIEQGEPFQRKVKAKHSRLKKRVIGHGGQANTPPFSEKPSMERSKSAPPIGENLDESLGKKLLSILGSVGLAVSLGRAGTAAADYAKKADAAEQQFQQELESKNKVRNEYTKYMDKYNFFAQNADDVKTLKQNIIKAYGLQNNAQANQIVDAFLSDIQVGTHQSIAALAKMRQASALIHMTNPKLSGVEVLRLAFADVMINNNATANQIKNKLDL